MSDNILEVTDQNFDSHVNRSQLPVLLDFWAPWCGPCKAMAPVMDQIAGAYAGKVTVAKCNVDENPATANRFGIKSIPTLILFQQGSAVDQRVGMLSRAVVTEMVENTLAGKKGAAPFPVV